MNLAHPIYLLLLILIVPFVYLLYTYNAWRKIAMSKLQQYEQQRTVSLFSIKAMLKIVCFICIVVALSDPIIHMGERKIKNEGIDIIVALDISTSMLAQDVEPNRLSRAKMLVSKIIKQQDNNRLGLLFFAGQPYLQMPLSVDKDAASMYINGAHPNLASQQGTNIADAVKMAIKAFNKAEKKYKALIIITDGEDHEGADEEAIQEARDNGIIVHTIGVGSEVPTPIPLENGSFKLDKEGKQVMTAINKSMISKLAAGGGGKSYFISNDYDPVSAVLNEIGTMDKKKYEDKVYASQESIFEYFLMAALLFLFTDWVLPNTIRYVHLLNKKDK